VPPSSLDERPPARAGFGAWVGASPVDGLIALALLALAAALLLYLARGALRRIDRRAMAGAAIVFAVALGARLVDLDGAGQTWDEDVNWSAGRNYVTNWLALDFRPSSWQWNLEHPPLTKLAAGVAAQWADGFGPARAVSAALVAAACALLVAIGRRLFSTRVGLLAGLIAALSPHLVAHGKVVGHEAMAAFLWTAAVLAALVAHDGAADLPEPAARRRLALRFAVVGAWLGAAVSSRFVNVLLAPLVGALLLVQERPGRRRRTLGLGLVVVPAVALLVWVALWPRLWTSPVRHLAESWGVLSGLHGEEPFLGEITRRPPATYFPLYLLATAPLGILAGAALWLGRAAARRERGSLVVALWLVAPLLAALSPVRQDGVRYIIPSLLALSLASAAGLDWLGSWLGQKCGPRLEARAFAAAAAALLLYLGVTCWRIHPYYLDYYGEQVGGPSGVARDRSFEVAWWGEGIAGAVAYINQHAARGARVHRGCVRPAHLTWLRGDLWAREARRPADADWILVYEPSWRRCPIPPGARMVYQVTAQGAPLAQVYRRAPAP
jgi:4-amino-4-deoxy-L-arabinose transferase-like glycosyltransferase